MRKIILIIAVISLIFSLSSCDKTEVDMELERARENESYMTDEEFKEMNKEDPEFLDDYISEMIDADKEQIQREKSELVDELESLEDLKRSGKGSKYSCNMINEGSTCIEYYGSFWTFEQVRLGCPDGIASKDPCPNDTSGGCNTGEGTMADMVSWMYLRGGGGMDAESIGFAKKACDATMMSSWITRY